MSTAGIHTGYLLTCDHTGRSIITTGICGYSATCYHSNSTQSLYVLNRPKLIIGASLSEPHIYVMYVNSVCLSVRTFITR